jgi:DNA ligase-associated metallophosphoesterase
MRSTVLSVALAIHDADQHQWHSFALGPYEFKAHLSGLLYFPQQQMVIVSDLHLEHGAALTRRGMPVSPYDTLVTLERLEKALNCVRELHPVETVVSLGDSFHDACGALNLMPPLRGRLTDLVRSFPRWLWITGNHDPQGACDLPGRIMAHDRIGDQLVLRHEPSPAQEGYEISGHLHPAAVVQRRGVKVKRKCFVYDTRKIILPAFGALTGGLSLSHPAFQGHLDIQNSTALLLGKKRIYSL